MKTKNIILLLTMILLSIVSFSCKESAEPDIEKIWGRAVKVKGETKSNFSAFARILNRNPKVEASVEEWSFKLYSGDSLLFDVNSNNYQSLNFTVAVQTPVNFLDGTLIVMMGLPYYDAYVDFVDEDIFQGKKPDKLVFDCTVVDMNGDSTNLTSTNTLEYIEKEPAD